MVDIEALKATAESVIRYNWDKEVADYLECLENDNENGILEDLYDLARFFGLTDLVEEYDHLPQPEEPEWAEGARAVSDPSSDTFIP